MLLGVASKSYRSNAQRLLQNLKIHDVVNRFEQGVRSNKSRLEPTLFRQRVGKNRVQCKKELYVRGSSGGLAADREQLLRKRIGYKLIFVRFAPNKLKPGRDGDAESIDRPAGFNRVADSAQ